MKNKITITVSGKPKSGKSKVSYIIKEILKVYDFEVEFDPGPDYESESNFNSRNRIDETSHINVIAKNTKIIVEEKQDTR